MFSGYKDHEKDRIKALAVEEPALLNAMFEIALKDMWLFCRCPMCKSKYRYKTAYGLYKHLKVCSGYYSL